MKRIFFALIGSILLVSCGTKSEAPKFESPAPSQTEQASEMSLDEMIKEPYKADQ